MSSQSHIIKKQVLHLELDSSIPDGRELQESVSEICRLQMVPMMEKLFDQLSESDECITIDRLDLDLGSVSPDRLEEELPRKIDEALSRELGDRIAAARADHRRRTEGWASAGADRDRNVHLTSRADAKTGVIVWFLRTGQLPWNAGVSAGRKTFAERLMELLTEERERAVRVLQEELKQSVQRDRFIYQCSDTIVAEALTACAESGVFQPVDRVASKGLIRLVPGLTTTLHQRAAFKPLNHSRARAAAWRRAVGVLFSGVRTTSSSTGEWLQEAASGIIRSCLSDAAGGSPEGIRERLRRLKGTDGEGGKRSPKGDPELHEVVARAVAQLGKEMSAEHPGDFSGGTAGRRPEDKSGGGKNQNEHRDGEREGGQDRDQDGPRDVKPDETGSPKQNRDGSGRDSGGPSKEKPGPEGKAGLDNVPGSGRDGKKSSGRPGESEKSRGGGEGLFMNGANGAVGPANGTNASAGARPKNPSGEELRMKNPTGSGNPDAGDDDMDRDQRAGWVHPLIEEGHSWSAGLVILHPFLPQFFKRLKLMEEKQFVSDEAKQRAVHLLQWLAAREQETPEEELLLNKLLCGLDPGFPVPAGIEVTPEEEEECENLLRNIVRQWEALKSSSPEAIRSTFLRREGLIGREGLSGGWKVAIERNTFDVLLDRLPWGISIIKMPWNPWLIHVEW